MEDMNNLLKDVDESFKDLGKDYPKFMASFGRFLKTVESDGALDKKTKELISIALSISSHCSWCIAFHVKNALDLGATKDEIMEVCFVSTLMGGGPSLMYSQLVMKAIEDFTKKE
jgi:AhpD family alkylhydroperoxidase